MSKSSLSTPVVSSGGSPAVVLRDGWVKVRGLQRHGVDIIQFVPSADSNPARHRLSPTCLLGRLLIGRKVNETVVFKAAHGAVQLQIVDAGPGEFAEPSRIRQ